ncbi:MAG: trypsin-like serine protease [Polyangiales bacterium]
MRHVSRSLLLTLLLTGCAAAEESEPDGSPVLAIESGVSVKGAGPSQQWEGIVMTMWRVNEREAEVCTATFITERHLVTAAHCYPKSGPQKISARAPTWNGNVWQPFDATVYRASTDLSADIAVVDLGAPQEWATPARRFKLFAGKVAPTDLHLYGYGGRTDASPDLDGTLRASPGYATVRARDAGRGYISATAGVARACSGDSGGPALREGTDAVVWGVFSAFSNSISRILRDDDIVCPDAGSDLRYASVSANLAFVERSLGKPCTRLTVDGLPAAQCW